MTAAGLLSGATIKRRARAGVALVAMCAVLSSCAGGIGYNDFDTAGNVSKKEYEGLLGRRGPSTTPAQTEGGNTEPPIPNFQSVLAAPQAPELADTRRVSIAVTESTPVRDILIELARKAGVDLELDPRISGGVIMTATDRPFIEVVERIADLAELRFRMERNVLRVELDDPYLEQYRMDVLNVARTGQSSAASSTDASSVAQAIGAGASGGGNNTSTSTITQQTRSDFWNTIGGNIDQILQSIKTRRGAAATADAAFVPEPTRAADVPATGAPAPAAGGAVGAAGGGRAGVPAGAAALVAQAAAIGPNQQAALAGGAGDAAVPALTAGSGGSAAPSNVAAAQYSLNPQAGIITVFASQRQQKAVERYLRDVRAAVTQQVLIEAKVVEVSLSDQYRAGVNWNAVFGPDGSLASSNNDNLDLTTNFTRGVVPPNFVGPTLAANWMNDGDLSIAVQLVKEFGTVRTLSSPRLTALNNQVAQLKVAQNQVFFDLNVTITEGNGVNSRDRLTVDSQIKTVPVGLIMNVQPAVDPISRRISLSMRPSITRVTGFINDPGVAVISAIAAQENPNLPAVSSPIPIIEVREMDSLLTMESGQTVVMGGLMQEDVQTTREGLPGLMDVPLVGNALAENIKQNKVTELIIFIRATLVNGPGTVADEDIRLYKTFTPDPRPLVF